MTALSRLHALCVLVAVVVSLGCGPRKLTVESGPGLEQHTIRSVVVVPFQRLTTPQVLDPAGPLFNVPGGAKRSDIQMGVAPRASEGAPRPTTTVPAWVPDKVAEAVYGKLKDREGLRVLPPGEAMRVLQGLGDSAREWTAERLAREVAMQMHVDAAVMGKVLIYRERNGSKWGADPAAVGFEVSLVAPDGQLLWTANYYEKQRPMNEDFVGFFEHGGGFVTADELIEYGAGKIARKFPGGQAR
jgi:hypothetical protein